MKPERRFLLVFSLLLILQACTSPTRPVSAPVPVEDRSVKNEEDNLEGYPSDNDREMQAGSSNLPGTKNGRSQNAESHTRKSTTTGTQKRNALVSSGLDSLETKELAAGDKSSEKIQ